MAVQSFPSFHVTGPIHHFVRPGRSSTIYYLGTAEMSPQMSHQRLKNDIFNAIGGRKVPMNRNEQGEIVSLAVLLNRYSKTAMDASRNAGLVGPDGHVLEDGWRSRWSRGSLVFGQTTLEMWQVFENYFSTNFATPGLEIGRYYPVWDIDKMDIVEADTVDEKLLFVGTAFPLWTGQQSINTVGSLDRSWKCFSTNPTDFPSDVRVPQ